jgi:hypothetical protein
MAAAIVQNRSFYVLESVVKIGLNRQGSRRVPEDILDHREIVLGDPVSVMARIQMARAYAMAGDKVHAKSAYEDFFTLWENADSHVPILLQAKVEYQKLQ